MRAAALAALLLSVPALASAQSVQEQAAELIADSTIEVGFDPGIAALIGDCFGSRLTTDEAEALLAATDAEAQQAVTEGMADYDGAVACAAGSFQ